MAELYDKLSSEFYDYHAKRGDIKFFTGYALEAGGPALEAEVEISYVKGDFNNGLF
jgi:hypothetical protein